MIGMYFISAFSCGAQTGSGDHGIAAFSFWQPKDAQRFEAGYKKHLQWHKNSGDAWDWYGWYVISGPHDGQFLDATFDHSFSDFMHPVQIQPRFGTAVLDGLDWELSGVLRPAETRFRRGRHA